MNLIETVKSLVLETAERLTVGGQVLTTAESCTGGGLSYWLTSVPGSSRWFERGFVTYCNQAKIDMLGVREALLKQYGAVSEEVARAMAAGALQHSQADISLAVTGIAGPDGGTPEKPVGTVWLAFATRDQIITQHALFAGDRQAIRLQSIAGALRMLLK